MLLGFKKFKNFSRKIQTHSAKAQLYKLISILFGIIILHTILMMHFEQLGFMDALWLTMTSATTVGYGDYAATTTEGRLITILLLYIVGIAVLAQAASMYFEYRQEIKDMIIKGKWYWKMKNHIIFLNCSKEIGEEYFYEAISGLRNSEANISDVPIVIVSNQFPDGLSGRLQKLGVVLVNKDIFSEECMKATNIKQADTIVIFSEDSLKIVSDSINFELIDRLRSIGVKGRIISEVINDKNRDRLRKVGADNTLRPIRSYPELLMRSILAPGSEQVIETLFNSSGEECIRYNLSFTSKWLDIINVFVTNDIGIPVAYENKKGEIINNPSVKSVVECSAIFTFVRKNNMRKEASLKLLFEQ